MAELSKEQKKDYAKKLYLTEKGISQKEIAARTGVTEATVCRWVKVEGWEKMRTSLLMSKEEQLSMLLAQLGDINEAIAERSAEGSKMPDPKEIRAILNLTAAIKNLEADVNIADKMAVGKEFLCFVRKIEKAEKSREIGVMFDQYIKSCL